jgi:hypothetical protein
MDKDKPESSRQGPVWCLSAWSFICIHRTSGEPNWPFGSIADVVVAHHASHSCREKARGVLGRGKGPWRAPWHGAFFNDEK